MGGLAYGAGGASAALAVIGLCMFPKHVEVDRQVLTVA